MYLIGEDCSTIINIDSNTLTKARYQVKGNMSECEHIPVFSKKKKLLTVVFDNQCTFPIWLEDKDIVIMSHSTYNRMRETIK